MGQNFWLYILAGTRITRNVVLQLSNEKQGSTISGVVERNSINL